MLYKTIFANKNLLLIFLFPLMNHKLTDSIHFLPYLIITCLHPIIPQRVITCSKLTIETLEQGVKCVQS